MAAKDLVRLLIRQGLFDRLNGVWLQDAVAHYRAFPAPWHVAGTDQEVNYIMAFALGGFTNILRVWLAQDEPESPEQVQKGRWLVLDNWRGALVGRIKYLTNSLIAELIAYKSLCTV